MKKILLLIPIVFALFSCGNKVGLNLEVITCNIRYDNPGDGINSWPGRKEIITEFLIEENPDIFGLQEALKHQYEYLDSVLQDYSSVFAGRDDGIDNGEMTPVFYDSRRFEMIESGTFWLSETPEVPGSRGWGAVLPRIVTWVKLNENSTGKEFYFFNTHFSHMSDSARIMSSGVLLERVNAMSGDNPFIISGDFNMLPESEAYKRLTQDDVIRDSYHISESHPTGPTFTFNGFKDVVGRGRIDYIFVHKDISVNEHSTLNIKNGELFISDHWPVRTQIIIP